MDARQLAGRFAAFTWYMEIRAPRRPKREAARFARAHWRTFAPAVSEGLGELLKRISLPPVGNDMRGRVRRSSSRTVAGETQVQKEACESAAPIGAPQA
jgi:hypothetical protein